MASGQCTQDSPQTQPAKLLASKRRKQIGKKTRFEVFKRDRFTCQYCGAHPPGVLLQIDHITAVAEGGTNDFDNLVTSCQPCNIGKGARSLQAIPQSLADKAKDISEREQQLAGYQAILQSKRLRLDEETWRVLKSIYGQACDKVKQDEYTSTKRFIEKLGLHAALEAAEKSLSPRVRSYMRFRYFCGVCWGMLRDGTT